MAQSNRKQTEEAQKRWRFKTWRGYDGDIKEEVFKARKVSRISVEILLCHKMPLLDILHIVREFGRNGIPLTVTHLNRLPVSVLEWLKQHILVDYDEVKMRIEATIFEMPLTGFIAAADRYGILAPPHSWIQNNLIQIVKQYNWRYELADLSSILQ